MRISASRFMKLEMSFYSGNDVSGTALALMPSILPYHPYVSANTRDMWDVWDESGRRKAVPPASRSPPQVSTLSPGLPELNRSESYDSHNKQSSDPVTRVPRSRDKSNTNLAPLFPPADVDLDNDSGRSCVPGPSTSKVLSEPRGSASKRLTMNQPYLCRPNVAIQCEASVRRVEFAVVK
ncbi:hypothetical protein FISHEDRAFT_68535 [Fistulina hepatica ATCC 64428]|uniref:Uncharacterized protein n=1 Tax=Fistulina hepatica ATCC 64428 TaxID=1128425 RepID=A0A0D7AQG2_9AGAR|nr:hypothetical protein FISHEDRAFT_68535 [Fistulina hepatica ATCC 64428]